MQECIKEQEQNSNIEKQVRMLQARKIRIQNMMDKTKVTPQYTLITAFLGTVFYYAIKSSSSHLFTRQINWLEVIVIGSAFSIAIYWFIVVYFRLFLQSKINGIESELIKLGASELQESIEEDFFNRLVKINFKYLDQYYMQTKEQANKSFLFTVLAGFIGLFILCIGIVLVFLDKITPGYIAAISGIIIEFITAVFFYLYNRTILKMSDYHRKLVLSQNISLALKITDDLEDDKKYESRMEIIRELTKDINKYLVEFEE